MTQMVLQIVWLLAIDAVFLVLLSLILVPLAVYKQAAFAVLKRNFLSYFSNPTGYVFLCLFVLLTSAAAFWPHEFFTNNLANLDQLNNYIPFIMLIFIPAITMGIWAEEKRQGTDELLLTIPADDFDIVIGKFLAAVGVFTASLLFSQFANYVVLVSLTLGDVDAGLFFANYFGYWLMGLSMIAIGMIGSFMTRNLTVSFILGMLFNAPLAFAMFADVIDVWPWFTERIVRWSIPSQFEPFGRGILGLSSTVYFLMIAVVGIYISIVLVGRRHWLGGRDGDSLIWHYIARVAALVVITLSVTTLASTTRVRPDLTRGKTASLSPATWRILSSLEPEYPIQVYAFLSKDVPQEYAEVKRNLESLLREFEAQGKISVRIYSGIETFSDEAKLAEERFGIRPQLVRFRSHGRFKEDEIILGAAFQSGLQRVVVPFFNYGIPVEYELIRSIATVAKQTRKKLGVIHTDASMMGGLSFAGGGARQIPKEAIIQELEKQYDVEDVDATKPIDPKKYDVLLAVQPSSLAPEGLANLMQAIRQGVPTAIFEDPFPGMLAQAPGTGQPRSSPGMMGQQGGMPKGDIRELWKLLGIHSPGRINVRSFGGRPLYQPDVVWHHFNPYQKLQLRAFSDCWVFVRHDEAGRQGVLNREEDTSRGIEELLLPYPGAIEKAVDSDMEFIPLVQTGPKSGTVPYDDVRMFEQTDPARFRAKQVERGRQVLAARIEGKPKDADDGSSDDGSDGEDGEKAAAKIRVVYVADIDLLASAFLNVRARPDEFDEIRWRFENVTFVLNLIDELSGDDAFIEVRSHKPQLSTLRLVELHIQNAREDEAVQRKKFETQQKDALQKAQDEHDKAVERVEKRLEEFRKRAEAGEEVSPIDRFALQQQLENVRRQAAKKFVVRRIQLKKDYDRNVQQIRRDADREILKLQAVYKLWAVLLPPIIPAFIGVCVFFFRLLREREGIEKYRLK